MAHTLRSDTTTRGRKMAGARSLWRANGMKEEQIGQPIIGIANSFTQMVPGHTHLHTIGQHVKSLIEEQGCFAAEFNTIAVDDGIAMGHGGMLYSLPSREIIADSIEYMCNAHQVDALVCISNCDKITPGMLIAAMRLNIPAVFVSGGPMEAGIHGDKALDLVDAMVKGADPEVPDSELAEIEVSACPTCGSCSGMFTANSMNCLNEALGLALPGNGTILATHINRKRLFERAASLIVTNTRKYYFDGDDSVLPRSIGSKAAFLNAMSLDIAMGGSTNTVLHLLAIAREGKVDFTMDDIDKLSRKVPNICKVAPSSNYHIQDVNRAGGIMSIIAELDRAGLIDTTAGRIDYPDLASALKEYDIMLPDVSERALAIYASAPTGKIGSKILGEFATTYDEYDRDREHGCIREISHAYNKDGGLAVLFGNIAPKGCIVKTAGVDSSIFDFKGTAMVYNSQDAACEAILTGKVKKGSIVVIRYEGPKGGPGMQEMLYPTSYLKSMHIDKECALITDGRFSGGTSGLSIGHISPEAAAGGAIALIKQGDPITINIPERRISLDISDTELERRREEEESHGEAAYSPRGRKRSVTKALRAYATFATSADEGAVRIVP